MKRLPAPSIPFAAFSFLAILFLGLHASSAADNEPDVLRRDNLVAWCIVPFDSKQRGPAARAEMLQSLGIQRCAYDWRSQHVPTFEQEILEYQKHNIEFFAFWSVHESAFELFEKYNLHPQIWQTLPDNAGESQAEKVELAAKNLLPLAQRTKSMGCKLGLYNHGGWGGQPKNLVAVCQRLREQGMQHVGIVYNFHHGHQQIDNWTHRWTLMKPFVFCLNLNGMNPQEQPKILGIGKGKHELEMIRTVVESGYDGPIGILDHRNELDAYDSLLENRDGLHWVRQELKQPGSGGPKPTAANLQPEPKTPSDNPVGRIYPGAPEYRKPPLTVEVRATLSRRDRYNILVASDPKRSADHWEIFSMHGSGYLTAYLPGKTPDHVRSEKMICDGRPHTLAMVYQPERVRLFVDGQMVADQAITSSSENQTAVSGGLGIGRLVEGNLDCDGTIDWVRLSRGSRLPATGEVQTVKRDQQTLGFWDFRLPRPPVQADAFMPIPVEDADDSSAPQALIYDPELARRLFAESQTKGDTARGASVFANAKLACLSCHRVGDHGGTVGPNLSRLAKERSPAQIIESVMWPDREVEPKYVTWKVLTVDGDLFSGYREETDAQHITLTDVSTGKRHVIAKEDIETEIAGSTVMPSGLVAAMSHQQQLDLIRFLCELGRDDLPLAPQIHTILQHSQMHGPASFPLTTAPVKRESWPSASHPVNRDRLYDFYTKQAEHFRKQSQAPMLLAAYPGLDGGQEGDLPQGHWGNQNESTWADGRWNEADLGSMQAGVFRAPGITVPRGVCVRLGEDHELSACFNPDTLTFDAVWSGGFVKIDSVRYGFLGGLRIDGQLVPLPKTPPVDEPFQYHGFYRHGARVVFAYRRGNTEYLDSAWVREGRFVREVAPVERHSMRQAIAGGPSQWPQMITTNVVRGTQRPYAIDTIELPIDNPWRALLFCGGHDFLPDGSAVVCTMQGDVWRVTGLDASTSTLERASWKRIATGLHHALGLVVADGQIYVQCRDQLTRLNDLNGDGETDFYECFSNAMVTSPAGHDFICGLQRDATGNFYTASGNQGLLRISPDGKRADVIATGFRNPDGLGSMPDGTITVPVSEGGWTPASAVNAVVDASSIDPNAASHFGFGGPRKGRPPELPLAYLPRGIDNSSGGQAFVDSQLFGPLNDQLLHFSFGSGSWFAILRNKVDGQLQGAVVPLAGEFLSGAHRGRFHPNDGQLYVSGMSGWGTYTPDDGCFQRVRFTGDRTQLPIGFHVHENGLRIFFAEPLDATIAEDPRQHFAQAWNYRYSGAYGSPEYSTTHLGVAGHDPIAITGAHVLADKRSLFLEMPDLQPVSQLHLRLHVNAADEDATLRSPSPVGEGHDLFVTVHKLDSEFRDFPGYLPGNKTIAAHPLLVDLASNAARVSNPWQRPIADAHRVEIATGSNLTYETTQLTVRANQPIALTLSNPDVVPHNWVLVQAGALERVGRLSNQLIADPQAYARQYIPTSDAILTHTDIVPPGEKQTIYFTAPSKPGRYPYLCTFPGHWMVMNGVLIVE